VAANQGRGRAIEGEVNLGVISRNKGVDITNAVLAQTIAGINHDLTSKPRACGSLLNCVFDGALDVKEMKNAVLLAFPLNNLELKGQNFQPNCFGGHKFC